MASVKMPLSNVLNTLLLHPSAITRQERHASSETAQKPSREDKPFTRKTFYLTARAAQVLTAIANKNMTSETRAVNEAIIFYNERGQYIEELIKKSIREALQEFRPVVSRRRVLVRREVPCTR